MTTSRFYIAECEHCGCVSSTEFWTELQNQDDADLICPNCGKISRAEGALPQPPKRLDEHGRCCGRKPLVYKRPKHLLFCHRCGAQYTPDGTQEENFHWKADIGGFIETFREGNKL